MPNDIQRKEDWWETETKQSNGDDFYKLVEGSNRMRILTTFVKVKTLNRRGKYAGMFFGSDAEEKRLFEETETGADGKKKPVNSISTKGWAWAVVRGAAKDGSQDELKIVQLSKKVLGQLTALKAQPDYEFDGFPMPYDITINAKGAGTKEVEYTVIGARQSTEVTEREMAELNKRKPIQDIVQRIYEKQENKKADEKPLEYPSDEVNPEDIPF